jgi:hypothetical protein
MFFSPLTFTLLPRSCFNRPALLLLTWWPIPISMSWIALQHFTLDNTNERFYSFFLGPASLWAMFAPVIVGGVIRNRANQKRK